jgi:glutathionyl-hydroquinone reductase
MTGLDISGSDTSSDSDHRDQDYEHEMAEKGRYDMVSSYDVPWKTKT